MSDDVDNVQWAPLGLLASAIAGRPLQVAAAAPGERSWTNGNVIFLDVHMGARSRLRALVVQASLVGAGSLERQVLRALGYRSGLKRRYLTVEGHRALHQLQALLPPDARTLLQPGVVLLSDSPAMSLRVARGRQAVGAVPDCFGTIHPRRVLSSLRASDRAVAAPVARRAALIELAHDARAEPSSDDGSVSPVGGGGPIGRWLSKLLSAARQARGGGAPGADSPTHWTRAGARVGRSAYSTATNLSVDTSERQERGQAHLYPEWDVHAGQYRNDWCRVLESEAKPKLDASALELAERASLRRPLARLGLGIAPVGRQPHGDDLDVDALVEARIEVAAGSTPRDAIFVQNARRRRHLSVLVLLDISGSAGEPAARGKTVHAQQRTAAASLVWTLHELGDRVALYAYQSQGRAAVHLMPIKRFNDTPGTLVMQRLQGLEPGAYSRLGAAIRHGTSVLQAQGGTPRQLLLVLSDGLAYDHGYEPAYGAADARRALAEARERGVGCLCLSVGASTDALALRRVFGASAHASLPESELLPHVIAPLFRSAMRSADMRRRIS